MSEPWTYWYRATIVNVVDGDTIDAVIDVGFRTTTTQRLRLLGVNALEMHDKDAVLRTKAMAAKEWMVAHVLNQAVHIHTEKADSFGRYLASVFVGDMNVNDQLVAEGFAVRYFPAKGGGKTVNQQ